MKNKSLSFVFILFSVMIITVGCGSNTKRDVRVLQAQVGQMTEEIVRLEEALQSTRTALQEEQNRFQELQSQAGKSKMRISALRQEEKVLSNTYRTPSGFELPSVLIQKALKNAGYYRGNIDGKIGPQTRESIRNFQRDQGLATDGVVGRKTWASLKVYLDVK